MFTAKGPKYTYMADLRAIWERGQSLVVYHHLGRVPGEVSNRAREGAANIQQALGVEPITLRFKRGPARAFYVVPQPDHAERIEQRVRNFLVGCWHENGHFTQVAGP